MLRIISRVVCEGVNRACKLGRGMLRPYNQINAEKGADGIVCACE